MRRSRTSRPSFKTLFLDGRRPTDVPQTTLRSRVTRVLDSPGYVYTKCPEVTNAARFLVGILITIESLLIFNFLFTKIFHFYILKNRLIERFNTIPETWEFTDSFFDGKATKCNLQFPRNCSAKLLWWKEWRKSLFKCYVIKTKLLNGYLFVFGERSIIKL